MPTLILLLILGAVYAGFCLASRRPEHAIYGYISAWLFFPKSITKIPVLGSLPWEEASLFQVVNAITALVLLLVCLTARRRISRRFSKKLGCFYAAFVGLGLFTLGTVISYLNRPSFVDELHATKTAFWLLTMPTLEMLYAALVGWACLRYIDSMEKIERVFLLFAISGIVLLMEVVALYYLDLVPALRPWVDDYSLSGRFGSIEFASFGVVGKVSIVNIGCMLYFLLRLRLTLIAPLVVAVMALPVFATLQKAPMAGVIVAIGLIFCLRMRQRILIITSIAGLAILASFVDLSFASNLPGRVNEGLGGTGREVIDVSNTIATRKALWLRGADIFIWNFPFGAGNGLVAVQMATGVPLYTESRLSDETTAMMYYWFVAQKHVTNTHNLFINFVVENGIPGLLFLLLWLYMLLKNFIGFLRLAPSQIGQELRRPFLAMVCIYGILAGMAFHDLFEATETFYAISFMLLGFTYLLPALSREACEASDGITPDQHFDRKSIAQPVSAK